MKLSMKRALTILLACLLDLSFGDPPNRLHPLLLMGRWLAWGRRLAPAQHRFAFGAGWNLLGLSLFGLPWRCLEAKLASKHSRGGHKGAPLPGSDRIDATATNLKICRGTPCGCLGRSDLVRARPRHLRQGSPLWRLFSKGGPEAKATAGSSMLLQAGLLKPTFAYRNLRQAVLEVHSALVADNLPEARRLLGWHLVSRDTSDLSSAEVVGAAIESLAENLTDSLLAPLLAYALGGLPPAWAYRFANTADAMWGYRTPELEQLGKFAAHLDDLLNWLPARLMGWLLVSAAYLSGADGAQAARTMRSQHNQTPSPNAGWTMSAMAGALGVTLNKRQTYTLIGGLNVPDLAALEQALRVADRAVLLAILLVCLVACLNSTGLRQTNR